MKIYLVGGAVRDKLLGLPIKERDWVVVGATVQDMLKLGYQQVGKEFPVFLHPKSGEEYALARMERKVKPGYKGFTFDTSPAVTLEEDLIRRDLTINAMAFDVDTQQLIDPYKGQQDIQQKILRHVSSAFAEDPVRILRVGRFLARYAHLGFHVAPETSALMQKMVKAGEVDALVAERVWKELERALQEQHPEKFFLVLAECGALPILFPHLQLNGQGMQALIAAAKLTQDASVRFAALLYALPEDKAAIEPKKAIVDSCNRYRVPTAYRELAVLTALHYQQALQIKTLSAEQLLQLLSMLDVFRRNERFELFLTSCEAIAASTHRTLNKKLLRAAACAAKAVDVQTLIAQGLEGPALAAKLKEQRQIALTKVIQQSD